jgi:HAD superfamily hydrolase (TIGR01509 family)
MPSPIPETETVTATTPPDAALPDGARLPAAVLWDMDGTLVDTEPYWLQAEAALVGEFGRAWTEADQQRMIGMPLLGAADVFIADYGVTLPREEIVARLLGHVVSRVREHVPWQPGARELLERLRAAGVPCALVTMSYRALTDAVLEGAPGAFDVVVPGDEVTHGKPHPEPYLVAAARLGVDPAACVAIEDSPPGIGSAMASGARTIGVQHIVAVEPRPGLSRVRSLEQVDLATLARVVDGQTIDLLAPR